MAEWAVNPLRLVAKLVQRDNGRRRAIRVCSLGWLAHGSGLCLIIAWRQSLAGMCLLHRLNVLVACDGMVSLLWLSRGHVLLLLLLLLLLRGIHDGCKFEMIFEGCWLQRTARDEIKSSKRKESQLGKVEWDWLRFHSFQI